MDTQRISKKLVDSLHHKPCSCRCREVLFLTVVKRKRQHRVTSTDILKKNEMWSTGGLRLGLGWYLERIVPLTGQNMQWSARPSKRLFRCCCIHFWTLEENCFTADFNQKRQLLYLECGGDNNDARSWPPLLALWGQSTSIDAIQVLKFQHMRWIPISPDEIHDTFNVDKWNVCKFCLFPLTMVKYLSVYLTLVTRSTSGIQVLWTQKLWYALRRMWWRRRNVR